MRIRWVRELAGINQSKVAKLLGCSQQTITDYESGTRDPDPYLMCIFCARFKVTTDYILRGEVIGCNQELAADLLKAHPELAQMPKNMARYMDMVPASSRESTGE